MAEWGPLAIVEDIQFVEFSRGKTKMSDSSVKGTKRNTQPHRWLKLDSLKH